MFDSSRSNVVDFGEWMWCTARSPLHHPVTLACRRALRVAMLGSSSTMIVRSSVRAKSVNIVSDPNLANSFPIDAVQTFISSNWDLIMFQSW